MAVPLKIAVLDDYHHVAMLAGDWESLGCEVAFFDTSLHSAQLPRTLAEFDAVVLMRERTALTAELMQQLPNLKLIVTTGMRNAAVDMKYVKAGGITMLGTGMPGYSANPDAPPAATPAGVNSTVEVAWALIFALMKRVTYEDRLIRQGVWQGELPQNLQNKTLGLIGLGRLGSQMVAPARAFGMEVLAWSENLTAEQAAEKGATYVSKDELMANSDVISVHLVLSHRTRGLIAGPEISLMKPSAYLVNTSRGPIIDHESLVEALWEKRIAGAGLDVYDQEPISSDDQLLQLENTVLTPHLGYVSRESLTGMYVEVLEDLRSYLDGDPIRVIA